MYEHIFTIFESRINKIDDPVEETFDILILRVLEEECEILIPEIAIIIIFHRLKPIGAVVASTIHNFSDIVLYKYLLVFGNFLAWQI